MNLRQDAWKSHRVDGWTQPKRVIERWLVLKWPLGHSMSRNWRFFLDSKSPKLVINLILGNVKLTRVNLECVWKYQSIDNVFSYFCFLKNLSRIWRRELGFFQLTFVWRNLSESGEFNWSEISPFVTYDHQPHLSAVFTSANYV